MADPRWPIPFSNTSQVSFFDTVTTAFDLVRISAIIKLFPDYGHSVLL